MSSRFPVCYVPYDVGFLFSWERNDTGPASNAGPVFLFLFRAALRAGGAVAAAAAAVAAAGPPFADRADGEEDDRGHGEEDEQIISALGDAPRIAILNKTDLPRKLDTEKLDEYFDTVIPMSAKNSEGLDELTDAIRRICALTDLDSGEALIYNERQRELAIRARDEISDAVSALRSGLTSG